MAQSWMAGRRSLAAAFGTAALLLLTVAACGGDKKSPAAAPAGGGATTAAAAASAAASPAAPPVTAASAGPKQITTAEGTFELSLSKVKKLTAADGMAIPAGYQQPRLLLKIASSATDPVAKPATDTFHLAIRKSALDGALNFLYTSNGGQQPTPMDPADCNEIPAAPDFCSPYLTNHKTPPRNITVQCYCGWAAADGGNTSRDTVSASEPAYLLLEGLVYVKDTQLQTSDFAVIYTPPGSADGPPTLDGPMVVVLT